MLAPLAVALLTLTTGGCRGERRAAVERAVVSESLAAERLERIGITRADLAAYAAQGLARAPGFVAPEKAGRAARRFVAQVRVERAEALASAGAMGAVVQVAVVLQLAPTDGQPALREPGVAAEPAGADEASLREALDKAARSAIARAVHALSLQFVEEGKSTREVTRDLSSPDLDVREHAVRVLADRGAREAVPALIERLRDPDPEVVERAVGALAQLRDPRAVPGLVELSKHREARYVSNLARIVGDIGGPEAHAWLLTIASGHPEPAVRAAASEALADMSARETRRGTGPPDGG